MLYVHQLTEEESEELEKITRKAKGRVVERARAILLSNKGYTVLQIAFIFSRSDWTIRDWIHRYEQEGSQSLYDKPKPGRRRKIEPSMEEVIEKTLAEQPTSFGYIACCWTIWLLLEHLIQLGLGVFSVATLRRALISLGYVCRRPRLACAQNDPLSTLKMAIIQEVKELALLSNQFAFLYLDESTVRLLPIIRRTWMKVRKQLRIITPSGWNQRFSLFGALDSITGEFTYRIFDYCRSEQFITFLEHLLILYPEKVLFLAIDHASIHTSKKVKQWVLNHPRIQFVWLPKRDPQKNPVEKIWWNMKQTIAANRAGSNISQLKDKCHQFFNQMTNEETIELTSLAA